MVDDGGSTPLHTAAKSGNESAVQALVEMKADPMIADGRGLLAYAIATTPGIKAMLAELSSGAPKVDLNSLQDYIAGGAAFGQKEAEALLDQCGVILGQGGLLGGGAARLDSVVIPRCVDEASLRGVLRDLYGGRDCLMEALCSRLHTLLLYLSPSTQSRLETAASLRIDPVAHWERLEKTGLERELDGGHARGGDSGSGVDGGALLAGIAALTRSTPKRRLHFLWLVLGGCVHGVVEQRHLFQLASALQGHEEAVRREPRRRTQRREDTAHRVPEQEPEQPDPNDPNAPVDPAVLRAVAPSTPAAHAAAVATGAVFELEAFQKWAQENGLLAAMGQAADAFELRLAQLVAAGAKSALPEDRWGHKTGGAGKKELIGGFRNGPPGAATSGAVLKAAEEESRLTGKPLSKGLVGPGWWWGEPNLNPDALDPEAIPLAALDQHHPGRFNQLYRKQTGLPCAQAGPGQGTGGREGASEPRTGLPLSSIYGNNCLITSIPLHR